MRRRLVIVAASGAFMWLITTVPVWAGNITQISTPTKAYIGATDPINFAGADGALFNKISGGGLTVTFSNNPCTPPPGLSAPCVVKLSVPDTWGTWGCPPFTQVACVEFTPKQLSVLWSGEYTYVRGVKNGVMPIDMNYDDLK